MQSFNINPQLYFNRGSLDLLRKFENTTALIVADTTMERLGYIDKASVLLRSVQTKVTTFTGCMPDPSVAGVSECIAAIQRDEPKVIVALGGGSVIDTAKAAIFMLRELHQNNGTTFERPTFVAVPTTSGTGSEVTSFSVITDAEGQKTTLMDAFMAPDLAILDPTCTTNIPYNVTVDTGLDVLTHALEAYVSTNASDFTDAIAEKAIKVVFKYLPILKENLFDQEARERMHSASCMAGAAFENAGLGINHSIAHAVGGAFHIPHGRSNAMLIESVIHFNADMAGRANNVAAEKYAHLALILDLPAKNVREGVINLADAITDLKRLLGVESGIQNLGIMWKEFHAHFDEFVSHAIADRCTTTTPRQPTEQDIINILLKAF